MRTSFKDIPVGSIWSRQTLADKWGYKAYQALARGVVTPSDENKIILFVTENKQRSATRYEDALLENILKWEGPNDHFAEDRMLSAAARGDEIHLFHRTRHHTDFEYRGELRVLSIDRRSDAPSRFVLEILDPSRLTWSHDQLLAAIYLYTQLKPDQIKRNAPAIGEFARWIGKSPLATISKLRAFALLDPLFSAIDNHDAGNLSELDRAVWNEFENDWTSTLLLASQTYEALARAHGSPGEAALHVTEEDPQYEVGETRAAVVDVRTNHWKFRNAVMNSYGSACCISGLQNEKLLVASHIVRWADDPKNRLNPQNGLCLSALHDRAFDSGLITVLPDLVVRVHDDVLRSKGSSPLIDLLVECNNQPIRSPGRLPPHPSFLTAHAKRFRFL